MLPLKEESRRAFKELGRRKTQDKKDLKTAYQLAKKGMKYPLFSQEETLKEIEKKKNKDLTWCSEKLNFRKYKAKIVNASISGERATKIRSAKALIKITRPDSTITEQIHTTLDTFEYYEWLEIREVIVKEKSSYKKYVTEELNRQLNKMSKLITVPPLQPRTSRRQSADAGYVIRNKTSIKFSAVELLNAKWKIDLSMLNTSLPNRIPKPPGTIVFKPEHGLYFEDGFGTIRFQCVSELPQAPTQHLTNLLAYTIRKPEDVTPFMLDEMTRKELEERYERREDIYPEYFQVPP